MSDAHDHDKPELPPKPLGPWKTALLGSGLAIGIGAVVEGAFGRLGGRSAKHVADAMTARIGENAAWGGVLGYWRGKDSEEIYDRDVQNAELKHELHEVKSAKTASFVRQLATEIKTAEKEKGRDAKDASPTGRSL